MILKYLQYRYVKARMNAYLDGDLPVKTRRFIARQIDENPLCYRFYIDAKQTKQALERSLPTVGKAETGQLDAIWSNIQAELSQPRQLASPIQRSSYRLRYGVAMLVFVLLLAAPLVLDVSRGQISPVPQHPFPEQNAQITSPATPAPNSQVIAFAVQQSTESEIVATDGANIPLQNTPAPRTPGRSTN